MPEQTEGHTTGNQVEKTGRENRKGLHQELVARTFIGKPDLQIVNSSEYQVKLPEIRELYKQAWRWHGTGRYHYHKDQVIDVLKEIADNGGLIPHEDPLAEQCIPCLPLPQGLTLLFTLNFIMKKVKD